MSEQAQKAVVNISVDLAGASEAARNQVLAYAQGLAAGLDLARSKAAAAGAADGKETA